MLTAADTKDRTVTVRGLGPRLFIGLAAVIGGQAATLCMPAEAAEPCDAGADVRAASSVDTLLAAADCYQQSGQALRALDVLRSALALGGRRPLEAGEAIAIRGRLGQVYAALGDYRNALEMLEEGVDEAGRAELPGAAASLLNDLGGVYMATGDTLQGLAAYADSARLASASPVLALTASVNLARALSETGAGAALELRLEALTAQARGLDDAPTKAPLLLSLAELNADAGGSAGRERARALASEAVVLARRAGDARLLSYAYGRLGRAYADLGRLDEALTATREAVLAAQRAGASESLYRWEWQTGRLLRRMGNERGALEAYRAAIDTLGRSQAALVTSRRGFAKDVLPLYEQYADLMLASTHDRSGPAVREALGDVQRTLEALRVSEVRNYFENQCAVPEVFDPARGQPEGVLVVYPVLFPDRLELLVGTGEELSQFTVDVGLPELTYEVNLLRRRIEDSGSGDAYLEPAQRLYDWLIGPLEPLLASASPTTLVFVPDGVLRTIPLSVLHDGERFLVERYSLATTPGLSLIGAVNTAPVTRALVNGIVSPVQGFPGLPFVATELRNIEQTVPSRVYSDETFRTATLEREILEGGYSIVHLATHAQFESDYRRSFLLAYDDVITMDELEDAVGSQRYTDEPVDLLVLSACQTAVGDERAALGLAGVAVKAGARSALASLWLINDESTARLVSEFYRELADGSHTKADALRGAQLLLLNDERTRHPAYWAPFLMIGDWR